MLADAVAQLIVGQAECAGSLPLVPAMLAQCVRKYRALMRIDRRTQILNAVEMRR